jgi:glycine/D-amino acid oxidase-like deaminating enzyme
MHLKVKHRYFVPMWTYIILTEPIPDNIYKEMGWLGREGIEDERIFVHYLRFTADNRLLFGGRDAPYYFGNKVLDKEKHENIFKGLDKDMREMFPMLKDIKITHRWGGPVAVTMHLPIVNNKLVPIPGEPFRYFFANGIRNILRAIDSAIEFRS